MFKRLVYQLLGRNNILYLQSIFPGAEEKGLIAKRKAFYSQFLKKGDLYFDVGANYGNRILPISKDGIHIVAVEPQAECIAYLRLKYGKSITIEPVGLSEKESEQTMFISETNTLSSFSADWIDETKKSGRFSQYEWKEERKIKMSTLDRLIEKYGVPRFIKIDVEGFEVEVVSGLSRPVEMISIEYAVPEHLQQALVCLEKIETISQGQLVCNYSVGESMEWALGNWLTPEDMKKEIASQAFIDTQFGDIYFKYVPGKA